MNAIRADVSVVGDSFVADTEVREKCVPFCVKSDGTLPTFTHVVLLLAELRRLFPCVLVDVDCWNRTSSRYPFDLREHDARRRNCDAEA